MKKTSMNRRTFLGTTGTLAAGTLLASAYPAMGSSLAPVKKKIALVGTGSRGIGFWGKPVQDRYNDIIEFVGLCDINPGRVEMAKKYMELTCPVFTDFDEMLAKTKPGLVMVTTVDATHHQFIIKALEAGCDVLTEKPMTTDEVKCQAILDAERKTGKKVIVGFTTGTEIILQL
jgi:predicted dehydrogenase